eukprot:1150012-Pelagomonas_calceolata.AAC.6
MMQSTTTWHGRRIPTYSKVTSLHDKDSPPAGTAGMLPHTLICFLKKKIYTSQVQLCAFKTGPLTIKLARTSPMRLADPS